MPNTPFGFTWGPMEVLRACSDKRFRVLLIRTPYAEVEVSVSPTGRSVRTAVRRGKRLVEQYGADGPGVER